MVILVFQHCYIHHLLHRETFFLVIIEGPSTEYVRGQIETKPLLSNGIEYSFQGFGYITEQSTVKTPPSSFRTNLSAFQTNLFT